ncbi:adenylate/guanylate cyclase domain-containing protein [Nocardioides sp. AE5]|uniref:adenylate/guanylate cyclase domain-containing protein n=1 Tax=Nocardioides sp. AE5 TaxID=2962573 RepID=UPI0028815BA4|nr:adenylate/guanylate cyclase domain-containing protein [Nocardioides sp. AE5]MDT0202336.1 adenylate/guanylate cyclase domain-containing protein [Nocardioides sp. AE5]
MTTTRPDSRAFGSLLLGPADQGPRRLRVRIQLLLSVLLVGTNVIGAGIVLALMLVIIPGEKIAREFAIAVAISGPTYVGVAVVLGASYGTVTTLAALRWATREEVPTAAERRAALRLPWRLSLMQALLWGVGAALHTLLAALLQPAAVLSVAFAVVIAGVVVSSVAYLFAEFALRPVAARALSDAPTDVRLGMLGVRGRLVVFWFLGTAAPVLGLVIGAIVVLSTPNASPRQFAVVVLGLSAVILFFGLLVTSLTAGAVTGPIAAVRGALERIRDGEFGVEVVVYDGTELGELQSGFNAMSHGLAERERIRDLFGRHVGHQVAAAATSTDTLELGGRTLEVSTLMIDLVGSTTYATEHPADDVVSMLNRFCAVVVDEVDAQGGLVNKFMGDAVLAIFGAPVALADHPTAALAAARAMADRLRVEVPEIGFGIGISTGEVVAGYIGDESRFEYTVIGDAVNAAARLTDLAKGVEGDILAMADTVAAAADDEGNHWAAEPPVVLRGRAEPTGVASLVR